MINAILVERDYKGHYERFALTPEEFQEFMGKHFQDIPAPSDAGASYSLSPMVHVWYRTAAVGDPDWNRFFTDMTFGLPQSDIEHGNLASIRTDLMQTLNKDLFDTLPAEKQAQIMENTSVSLKHDLAGKIRSAVSRTGKPPLAIGNQERDPDHNL